MRLYLLPLSTRRTLLYGQRLGLATTDRPTIADRVAVRAAKLWASWEERESGWQRRVVDGGNLLLRRVPFEEWALKSIPPLSRWRRNELQAKAARTAVGAVVEGKEKTDTDGKDTDKKVEVVYPQSMMPSANVEKVLLKLASETQAHHKRWLFWCFVGMPLSAPFALVPIIPNLPFFYLVYRAWSHWRALAGGKHIRFLLQHGCITLQPSPALDEIYKGHTLPQDAATEPEGLLLTQERGREAALMLGMPQLVTELERAVFQVESNIERPEEKQTQAQESSSSESESDSDSDSDSESDGDYKRKQSEYATEKIKYYEAKNKYDDDAKTQYNKKYH